MFPNCAGRFQSPIDIRPELAKFSPALQPLKLQGFDLQQQEKLQLLNNGHTGEGPGGGLVEGVGYLL